MTKALARHAWRMDDFPPPKQIQESNLEDCVGLDVLTTRDVSTLKSIINSKTLTQAESSRFPF